MQTDLSLTLALSQHLDNHGSMATTSMTKTSNMPATTVAAAKPASDDPLFGPDSIYSSYLASLKVSTHDKQELQEQPAYESRSMFASLLQPLNSSTAPSSATTNAIGSSLLQSNTSTKSPSAEPVTTQKVLDSDVSDSEEDKSQESSDDEPDIPAIGKGMAPIMERRGPDHKLMVKRKVDSWRVNSNPEAELAELNQNMIERMKDRHRQQYKIAAIRQQQQQQMVPGYGAVAMPPLSADGTPYMMPVTHPPAPPHDMMMMQAAFATAPTVPPVPPHMPMQPTQPPMPIPTVSAETKTRSKQSVPTSPALSSAGSAASTPAPRSSSSASSVSSAHHSSSDISNIRIAKERLTSVPKDPESTSPITTDADDDADQEDNASVSSESNITIGVSGAATGPNSTATTASTAVEKKDSGDLHIPKATDINSEKRRSMRHSRSLPNLKKKKKKATSIRRDNSGNTVSNNNNNDNGSLSSPAIRPQRSVSTSTARQKIKHSKSNPDIQYWQQQRQYYYPYHQQPELHQEWDRMQAYQREQQLKQLYLQQFYNQHQHHNSSFNAIRRSHQPSAVATYPLSPPTSPPVMHQFHHQHFQPQHSSVYMGTRAMYDPATPPMSPPFPPPNYHSALH